MNSFYQEEEGLSSDLENSKKKLEEARRPNVIAQKYAVTFLLSYKLLLSITDFKLRFSLECIDQSSVVVCKQ